MGPSATARVLVIVLPIVIIVIALVLIQRTFAAVPARPLTRRDLIAYAGASGVFVLIMVALLAAGRSFASVHVLLVGVAVPLLMLVFRAVRGRRL
jgi:hypothetical protein